MTDIQKLIEFGYTYIGRYDLRLTEPEDNHFKVIVFGTNSKDEGYILETDFSGVSSQKRAEAFCIRALLFLQEKGALNENDDDWSEL